jgi:hypothetical protein
MLEAGLQHRYDAITACHPDAFKLQSTLSPTLNNEKQSIKMPHM